MRRDQQILKVARARPRIEDTTGTTFRDCKSNAPIAYGRDRRTCQL